MTGSAGNLHLCEAALLPVLAIFDHLLPSRTGLHDSVGKVTGVGNIRDGRPRQRQVGLGKKAQVGGHSYLLTDGRPQRGTTIASLHDQGIDCMKHGEQRATKLTQLDVVAHPNLHLSGMNLCAAEQGLS